MKKVLITTVPFADKNPIPLQMLEAAGIEYLINPLGRKLNEKELALMVSDFDAIIAGTEKITDDVMENGKNLRLISRVGIGLDSVDLLAAKRRGVKVSYTPDAPSPAIAEFTVGLMLTMLHSVHLSNFQMHVGHWNRYFGRRIPDVTIGVIGLGRIGKRVLNLLRSFGSPKLLLNDISPNLEIDREFKVEWVTKEEIYKQADVITFHLPLTKESKNMVRKEHLKMMKPDAILINTARGGIINEDDLYDVMNEGHLSGASIDVFVQEPYSGRLREIDRCILTAHMGSSSVDCRTRMEREATEEAVRFLTGKPLEGLVPEHEYTIQREGLER
jgi:D-3-phosphoglycerate dehydrogenase